MTLTEELFETHRDTLYGAGIKRGLSPADAEEAVGEAFARLLTKPKPSAVLLRLIHRSILLDMRRDMTHTHRHTSERPVGLEVNLRDGQRYVPGSPELSVDHYTLSNDLRRGLEGCSRGDATVFAMHYLNGLTYDEIGLQLGISRQRAYQRAERARQRIIEEVAA